MLTVSYYDGSLSVVVRRPLSNFFKRHLLNYANFAEMIVGWYPIKVVQKLNSIKKSGCHGNQYEKHQKCSCQKTQGIGLRYLVCSTLL